MSATQRLVELARLTGRLNDPSLRRQLRRLELAPDSSLEELLMRKLTAQAGDEAFDPQEFRVPTEDELVVPGCEDLPHMSLGTLARARGPGDGSADFSFPLTPGHLIFLGGTRMGKTVAVRQLLAQLPPQTHCLIADSENDPAYLDLALASPPEAFEVVDARDLRIGLFAGPSGTAPGIWRGQVNRNARESLFIRDGGVAMLSFLLDHCQKDRDVVSLRDVYEALISLRFRLIQGGREFSYFESLKNRLEGLLVNPVFDCAVGFDIKSLTRTNTLLRCRGMGLDEFALVLNDLLLRLSCSIEPSLARVPSLVVVVEELHRMTNPQRLRRADIAEPVILDAVRTLAKCGVSFIFIDQVPSELPPQILANCSFRAVFNTIEGRDLDAIQRSLSLEWQQRAALSRLAKRVCVVQYANPRFPEPFLVRIRDCPVALRGEGELAARRQATLGRLDFIRTAPRRQDEQATHKESPLISKPALDYFAEIAKDQFAQVSKRDQQLGIPLGAGHALRKELEAAELITIERVNTYGRARRIVNARITEKGYELLRGMKVPCEKPHGRGGWEHVYHQRAIAAWARANGYTARIEHTHEGKSADVALEKDGRHSAVEILCRGVEKELANLRDLCTGYEEIWFCVKDEAEIRRLRELIRLKFAEEARAILSRVKFMLLGDFQDELARAAER